MELFYSFSESTCAAMRCSCSSTFMPIPKILGVVSSEAFVILSFLFFFQEISFFFIVVRLSTKTVSSTATSANRWCRSCWRRKIHKEGKQSTGRSYFFSNQWRQQLLESNQRNFPEQETLASAVARVRTNKHGPACRCHLHRVAYCFWSTRVYFRVNFHSVSRFHRTSRSSLHIS